eukprot:359704-Chlamydomonas_euryale.AAC.5
MRLDLTWRSAHSALHPAAFCLPHSPFHAARAATCGWTSLGAARTQRSIRPLSACLIPLSLLPGPLHAVGPRGTARSQRVSSARRREQHLQPAWAAWTLPHRHGQTEAQGVGCGVWGVTFVWGDVGVGWGSNGSQAGLCA